MPCLTAERSIHVHRVSSTQITTFIHDLTDNSTHVNRKQCVEVDCFRLNVMRRTTALLKNHLLLSDKKVLMVFSIDDYLAY